MSSTVRGIWSKKVGKVAGVTLTDDATSSAITHVVWSKSTAPAQWLALPVKVVTEAWMVAALQEKRRPLLAMDTEHAFELPVARAPAPEPRPAKRARRSAPIVTSTVLTRLVNASYPYLHANMHLTDVLRVLHKYRFRLGGADKSSRYGTTASGALGRRDYVNQFAIALAMAIAMLTALGEDPEGGIDSVATLQSDRFSRIPYVGASTRALIAEILRRDDGTCEELEKHRDPLYAGFFLDSKGVPRVDEKNEPLQWSYALHELQRVPGIGRGVAMKCIRAGVKTIAALRAHVAAGNAAKLFNDRLVLNHVEEIVLSLSSDDVERIRCSILDALRSGVGSICGGRGRAFVQLDPALWDVRAVGRVSFIYRYILRESCSQFDSLLLTYLTISPPPLLLRSCRAVARRWAGRGGGRLPTSACAGRRTTPIFSSRTLGSCLATLAATRRGSTLRAALAATARQTQRTMCSEASSRYCPRAERSPSRRAVRIRWGGCTRGRTICAASCVAR